MADDRARRPGRRRRRGRRRVARSTPPPAACPSASSRPATWASGTSSRSSKLIHGGLRYLEMLDFGLVREALHGARAAASRRSRRTWSGRCRSSTRCTHRGLGARSTPAPASLLYDTMACSSGRSRGVPAPPAPDPARRPARWCRRLRKDALIGALQYYDAQVDDARHTMTVARTAAAYGALVANRARVIGFLRQGERVTGAPWSGPGDRRDVRGPGPAGGQRDRGVDRRHPGAGRRARPVPRARVQGHPPGRAAGPDPVRAPGSSCAPRSRVLFVIPWGRHWIIGTTDTDWDAGQGAPGRQLAADIDYLLEHVNAVLDHAADPRGRRGRVRRAAAAARRASPSRRPSCPASTSSAHPVPGLVVVAGGKYTTYRVMAADAVDEAVHAAWTRRVPDVVHRRASRCSAPRATAALWNQRRTLLAPALGPARGPDRAPAGPVRLADRRAARRWSRADPTLGEPLPGADDYLRAEVVYAVTPRGRPAPGRRAGPPHPDLDRDLGPRRRRAPRRRPALMAPVLGWDEEQTVEREVEHYRTRVEAERDSQDQARRRARRRGPPRRARHPVSPA